MTLRRAAKLTLVGHALLALSIAAHARLTGREAGRWPRRTVALGVFGVAGYWLENRR